MPVANAVAGVTLSDQTMSQTATAERLDDVDADNPRIVTRAVADRYASNTLNRPQYRVGDTDISVVNRTPTGRHRSLRTACSTRSPNDRPEPSSSI